jgi:hypothetical protein
MFRAAAAASAIALLGPGSAAAVTATGIAVGSIGDDTQVGLTEDRTGPGGIGPDAIKYFIPLENTGIYGAASGSCGTGFGTCSDFGNGGGRLTMYLRFEPVSTSTPSTLQIIFEDLDLIDANDPAGFLEKLRVLKADGVTGITPWITDIDQILLNGDIEGDANSQQLLSVQLGTLTALDDPLFLVLQFKSTSTFYGQNTPEYLIATVTSPDPAPPQVPLPAGFVLMGTVLAGTAGLARWRRRRAAAS